MCGAAFCDQHEIWFEPKVIKYREIEAWPHMNDCVKTLEVLNIGMYVIILLNNRRTKI